MRYFGGNGYCALVYVLPLIFLSFNDIYSDSIVEAASTISTDTNGSISYTLENKTPGELKEPGNKLRKHIVKPEASKVSLGQKLKRIFVFITLVSLAVGLGFGYKYGKKRLQFLIEQPIYRAKLAKFEKLGNELKIETDEILHLFTEGVDPEEDELKDEISVMNTIAKYKHEYFKDVKEDEKLQKQIFWKFYMLPYLKLCNFPLKERTKKAHQALVNALDRSGFHRVQLIDDPDSVELPYMKPGAVMEYVKETERNLTFPGYRKLLHYEKRALKFYRLRKDFFKYREYIYKFIAPKDPEAAIILKELGENKSPVV